MKKLILSTIVLLIILTISCDSPTEVIDNTQPGRRDYVWSVDTLDAPGTAYYRMWGSSPSNLWMISSSNWDKSIAHYDGEKWSLYGVPGIISPFSIYGFSSDNIYLAMERGQIWHFNGSNWVQEAALEENGHFDLYLANLWGDSPNSIYATGAYPDVDGNIKISSIAHFENGKWGIMNTDALYGNVTRLYENNLDNRIYIKVIDGKNYRDSTSLYEYVEGKYNPLYRNSWTKGKQADLSLIDGNVYFIMGSQISMRAKGRFYPIVNVTNPDFNQKIWGRNSKDLFLLMSDGLAHYNGSDIRYLFYFNRPDDRPYTQIYGAALFENTSIFLVREASTGLNMIYTGRINVN
jgi:hypothetical protein